MKQAYEHTKFKRETLEMIWYIDKLCANYQAQGLMLSVRQLYYQLVARGIIENTERSYKNTAALINKARLAGFIDWDAIEDRGRDVEKRSAWVSGSDIMDATASSFHMDMWDNQDTRVFVVVEKAALAGVLGSVCRRFDVPLLAARGYPSVSILRELAIDYMQAAADRGQNVILMHMGDHDPSGIDMTRDLKDRLTVFMDSDFDGDGREFKIDRLALTMPQIIEKKPPTNPAKLTDSRIHGYSDLPGVHRGNQVVSWELDALEPSFMSNLLESNIREFIDPDRWTERQAEIEHVREKLQKVATKFKKDEAKDNR